MAGSFGPRTHGCRKPRQQKSSRRAADGHPPDAKVAKDGRCGVGLPLRALRHLGHCPAPPRLGPRWLRATVSDRFLGCGRMRFLPPLVYQDVEGYEEVFEVHAQSTAFRSGSWRGGNGEPAGSGPATLTSSGWPLSASFWRAACAGAARLGGGLHDSTRRTAQPHLGRVPGRPIHDSILLKNWSRHQSWDGSRDQSQHQRGHGQQEERGRRADRVVACAQVGDDSADEVQDEADGGGRPD